LVYKALLPGVFGLPISEIPQVVMSGEFLPETGLLEGLEDLLVNQLVPNAQLKTTIKQIQIFLFNKSGLHS
jgi:hypothetical protein